MEENGRDQRFAAGDKVIICELNTVAKVSTVRSFPLRDEQFGKSGGRSAAYDLTLNSGAIIVAYDWQLAPSP